MAEVLEKLPQGCDHTIDILNRLPTEVFSDICHDVLFFLQFKIPAIDIETLKERFEENNIHIEDKDLQSILHILKYIYKSAGKLKVHHDSLKKQLLSSLKFTEETSENIAYNWKEYNFRLKTEKGNKNRSERLSPLRKLNKRKEMTFSIDDFPELLNFIGEGVLSIPTNETDIRRCGMSANGDVLRSDHSFPMFDVGKLIDMQWKLGVAVSSDDCRNLNSTFVAMTLKVADTSGNLTSHAFEMTIPQFKNLSKQLQEMAKSMEMV